MKALVIAVTLATLILMIGLPGNHAGLQPGWNLNCSEPLSIGNCKGNFKRWYFDKASQTCKQFTYKGCGGNSNKFWSKGACDLICKTKDLGDCKSLSEPCLPGMECKDTKGGPMCVCWEGYDYKLVNGVWDCRRRRRFFDRKLNCSEPVDFGRGEYGPKERWYFDSATNTCKQFGYLGNHIGTRSTNRFWSKGACDLNCKSNDYGDCSSMSKDNPCHPTEECVDAEDGPACVCWLGYEYKQVNIAYDCRKGTVRDV